MLWFHPWGQLDASYHTYPDLAIYFGQAFGRHPTFQTLTSVGRKKLSSMSRNVADFSSCGKVLYYQQTIYYIKRWNGTKKSVLLGTARILRIVLDM